MSDLISRSALIEDIREIQSNLYFSNIYCDRKTLEGISSGFDKTVSIIEEQPTVDTVAVLRCRDCTHWGVGSPVETERVKCCEYAGYMIGERSN